MKVVAKTTNIKLRESSITIKFIFDIQNMLDWTLTVPFKKNKTNKKSGQSTTACNNGSTCAESKLFGYFRTMFSSKVQPKTGETKGARHHYNFIENIIGAIAVWFRNRNKEDTYISSYCYDHLDRANERHTLKLMLEILQDSKVIDSTSCFSEDYVKEELNEMVERLTQPELLMIDVARSFALPCPGCQKNYYNYLHMKRFEWDSPKGLIHDHNTTCTLGNIQQ